MSQGYRPPALLAKMAAQLQILSGGRFILGIGAGWKENEYRSYGYDFPSGATRIHQLEESVQIIRSMFTQPKTTFTGKYYHVEDAMCEPRPDPLPPIMIGGMGRKLTLRVVAKHADWWNCVGSSVEEMKEYSDVLDEHCRAIGRDPKSIVRTFSTDVVAVAPTSDAAWVIANASPFYKGSPAAEIVGNPDEVAAKLQRYIDIGVEHFILRFMDFPRLDSAKLFMEEVMPRFRS
jgi:alkanesulfonate monooxygenase SsuD/methylene tetrahydromethanopterin reductase-like flavin-dependent oxidoreductase (luciferase family)